MRNTPQCEGKIHLGPLPWAVSERLAQISANWLEFLPGQNALLIKDARVEGCPALTGIPCEIITMLSSIPPEIRDKVPGGAVHLKDPNGRPLRLVVEKGEIRIQWPRIDYTCATQIPLECILGATGKLPVRAGGWARFAASAKWSAELNGLIEQYGGEFPEGSLPTECKCNVAAIQFKDADIRLQELLSRLKNVAEPPESLQADLSITFCATPGSEENFRICIRDGEVKSYKPSMWGKD